MNFTSIKTCRNTILKLLEIIPLICLAHLFCFMFVSVSSLILPFESITFAYTLKEMSLGETWVISGKTLFENKAVEFGQGADVLIEDKAYIYESKDVSIVKVDRSTGFVETVGEGNVLVTATDPSNDDVADLVINVYGGGLKASVPMPNPGLLKMSPDGERIYVISGRGNGIRAVDALSGQILAVLNKDLVGEEIQNLLVSPDGNRLYVASRLGYQDDLAHISIIDANTFTLIKRIDTLFLVGGVIGGIALSDDGRYLYMTASDAENKLQVVDTEDFSVKAVYSIRKRIPCIRVKKNAETGETLLYLRTSVSRYEVNGSMVILNPETGDMIESDTYGLYRAPEPLIVHPDLPYVYMVAEPGIIMFDSITGKVLKTIEVGDKESNFTYSPVTMHLSADGKYLYASAIEYSTSTYTYELDKFSAENCACAKTIRKGFSYTPTIYDHPEAGKVYAVVSDKLLELNSETLKTVKTYFLPGSFQMVFSHDLETAYMADDYYKDNGYLRVMQPLKSSEKPTIRYLFVKDADNRLIMWRRSPAEGWTKRDITEDTGVFTEGTSGFAAVTTAYGVSAFGIAKDDNGDNALMEWRTSKTDGWAAKTVMTNMNGKPSAGVVNSTLLLYASDPTGSIMEFSRSNLSNLDLGWTQTDITMETSALSASGNPAYAFVEGFHHIFFKDENNHLREFWKPDAKTEDWRTEDLTALTGSFSVSGDPAYVYENGAQHVFAKNEKMSLKEYWWTANTGWHEEDLSHLTDGASVAGNPCYGKLDGVQHVLMRDGDGHLVEYWWTAELGWHKTNISVLTEGKTLAGDPALLLDSGVWRVFGVTPEGELTQWWWTAKLGWHTDTFVRSASGAVYTGSPFIIEP